MTERTQHIIMACKGVIFPENPDCIDRVKMYMAHECMCDKQEYTGKRMERIIREALYDYVDSCDRPSMILRIMACVVGADDFVSKACISFGLVRVKDASGKYINGFSEELWRQYES